MSGFLLDTNCVSTAQKRGIALSVVDGLIAATAKHHQLTLATRNVKDFRLSGVSVLNPWDLPVP